MPRNQNCKWFISKTQRAHETVSKQGSLFFSVYRANFFSANWLGYSVYAEKTWFNVYTFGSKAKPVTQPVFLQTNCAHFSVFQTLQYYLQKVKAT